MKMLPMAYTVVGESTAQAQEREQMFLHDFVDPMASLTLLSELMNYDFAGLDLDAPITDELIGSVSGIRGLVQNLAGPHRWRHRDLGGPGRSPGHPVAGPSVRGHRRRGGRSDGGVVHHARPATASSSPPRTRPVPTRTWFDSSCPSSSAEASFATTMPGRHCARTSGWPDPSAPRPRDPSSGESPR